MAGIAALTAAYVLSQFFRSFLAVLTPALISELGATKAELSMASGAWFIAFALMQFVVGVSLDRFGPKRTAAILLGVCGGAGGLIFASATAPWMITLAMVLIGMGCAPVLMASVFIFAREFPPARFAVLTSTLIGVGSAGNVFGSSPLANAAEAFGWRWVMLGLVVVTVAVALAIAAFVRDPEKLETEHADTGFSGYLDLLRLRVLWPIIPLTAINYAPAVGIRGLWAGPYLADVYGATAIVIGQVTLFMALAMVAGNFLYGPLDQFFRTRKWVAVVGNSLSLCAILWLALHAGEGIFADAVVLVLIGVTGASYGLLMAHARAFLPMHLTGRGVTLMNFFSIGGVGVMQFVTGAVVTASTVPGDPLAAYRTLFVFYAAMLAVALIAYLPARDARPAD
ncbi:MFS transporter [Mesorhizobium australicum]|uniref:Sugar phosphate permease n=1 Tax=Mesorhizobium australicum TaxID=536018 RepID=A0A1X7PFI4_9HYPH|nr:MFS transporter [Mesorhizobium australicum]SMH49531.1 Sugar phosphate permease [Mesorhizobium australicum]